MAERSKLGAGGAVLLLIFLIILAGFAVYVFNFTMANRKIDLEKALANVKSEYAFAQIAVISNDNNYITADIRLLSPDGSVIADKSLTLEGSDIYLECKVASAEKGNFSNALVFPFNVYTESVTPERGLPLTNLYLVNGFPSTYALTNMNRQYMDAVAFLCARAMAAGPDSGAGSGENRTNIMVNDARVLLMDISLHPGSFHSIGEGSMFNCIVHPNGGLELMEVK